ncbi:MAG: hypothetical protein MJ229_08480, partial [bacterium]|nr:hypothetical protein [bacterium]
MDLDFFSKKILIAISNCDLSKIYDIRLRLGFPIKVNYNNSIKYLTSFGVQNQNDYKIFCEQKDIDFILSNITENSIYAFNNQIKNGYITTKNGVRIGLSGTCVLDESKLLTRKGITSLNIRVQHEINGCSNEIYEKVFINDIRIG